MKISKLFTTLFLLFSNTKFAVVSWLIFHIISLSYVYNNFSINIFWVFSFYTLLLFLIGLMFIVVNTKYIHYKSELEKNKSMFEEIFNFSSDAIFITKPPENQIVDCNQTALKMFEIADKKDIIGKNGHIFHLNSISDEEVEIIKNKIKKNIAYELQLEYKTLKNNTFWGHLNGSPMVISNEEFTINRILDITSRKNAELSLFKNQKLTELIAEISPIQIWIHDIKNQKIDYANKAFYNIVGYTPEEVIALGPAYFNLSIYPDDIPLMQSLIEKIFDMQDDDTLNFQHRVIDKSKNVHWQEFRIKVFERDSDGKVIKIIGNSIDITETKETESKLIDTNKELKQTNEELDAFVYRASHDLRAPLTSVLGLLNLTQIENKDPETVAYVPLMQKSIERLLDVINDLINFSKNSRLEISSEKIDFVALTNDVFNEFLYLENANHIELIIEKNLDFDFYSDYMRLYLLFNNLISNAIKYHDFSKQNQYIKIKIESKNQFAKITIEDNGMGIADEYQDKIFNMFFRANAASTGSGLGLYIVKGILEKLNGKINMQSKRGEGTSFIVEIPNSVYFHN